MNTCVGKQIDPRRKSLESLGFEAGLQQKIVGQDEAAQAGVDYQVFRTGLGRPMRNVVLGTDQPAPKNAGHLIGWS